METIRKNNECNNCSPTAPGQIIHVVKNRGDSVCINCGRIIIKKNQLPLITQDTIKREWPTEKVEKARMEICKRDHLLPHHLDFIGAIEEADIKTEIFSFNVNALGKYYRSTRSWLFRK